MLYTRSVIALVYDVHGNRPALEAVVSDARAQGTDHWILGGDYALFGPDPEETVELLRTLSPAMWIRGNGERWTAQPGSAPDNPVVPAAIAACREALGEAAVTELGGLPEQGVHEQTRYVHASPISDVRSFLPEPGADEQELLDDVSEPRLVFGHTHLPFRRTASLRSSPASPRAIDGVELVNPGSVGLPFDGDQRAAYALVHADRRVEHRRVPYDHAAGAARMRARWPGEAWAETVARRIEHARMDV
jgi:diadenosine tetraphosphatase ApaH/serine/threonine PP2A family protein phosphatase